MQGVTQLMSGFLLGFSQALLALGLAPPTVPGLWERTCCVSPFQMLSERAFAFLQYRVDHLSPAEHRRGFWQGGSG